MINQSEPSKEPILIVIYNHKGGVGKTTSTHNIGVTLSKLGLRVLLVDADPQYNLTGIIFADKFDMNEDGKCDMDDFYAKADQRAMDKHDPQYLTLGTLLTKLIKHPPVDLSDAKRVELTSVHEYKNLFFLPGFWTIKDLDEFVARGLHNQTYMQNIPGYITNILRETGRVNNIDIILVDMSPSSNCFDGAMFCGCDYFIAPFGHDFFSYQSMKSMKSILVSWMKSFHNKSREEERSEFGLILTKPKFLGAFPQRIKTRTSQGKEQVEKAISNWIQRVYSECFELSKVLQEEQMISSNFKFKRLLGVYEFNSAGLDAQSSGRPICDISFDHIHERNGKTRNFSGEDNVKKVKIFNCYLNIIAELFSNMEPEDLLKLGSFKLICQQHSNMLFGHQVSYIPEKPMTPLPIIEHSDQNQDSTRWYEDSDIINLAHHYIQESNSSNVFVYYPVPAAAFRTHSAKKGTKENENTSYEYLDAALAECKKKLDEKKCKMALAPLLINDNHWIVVTISKIEDDNFYHINVYDPMSTDNGKVPPFLKSSLKIFGKANKSIIPTTAGSQDDGHSCGVWVVEYIRCFINPTHEMPTPDEIYDRRIEHSQVLFGLRNSNNYNSFLIPELDKKKTDNFMDDFETTPTVSRKNRATKRMKYETKQEDPAASSSDERIQKKNIKKRKK